MRASRQPTLWSLQPQRSVIGDFFNQGHCSKRLAMSHNLQELVEKYHAFYDVLPYHVVIEEGHGAVLRIRISHYGNVDQRAGLPEQHAPEEVEKELQDLGVARR